MTTKQIILFERDTRILMKKKDKQQKESELVMEYRIYDHLINGRVFEGLLFEREF